MSRFVSKLIILKKKVELRQDNYGGELSLLEDKLGVDLLNFTGKKINVLPHVNCGYFFSTVGNKNVRIYSYK